jgi:hypothetical protein
MMRYRRLPGARVAVLTDRVRVFGRAGPDEDVTAEGRLRGGAIRDVALTGQRIWVLPAPGDRVLGETETLPLRGEGGFDLAATGSVLWILGYDPVGVELTLARLDLDDPDGGEERIELPRIPVEEDRYAQRPAALGVWRDRLLVAARGQVWIGADPRASSWIPLLAAPQEQMFLPTHAWQSPPRVAGDRLFVAWPWGLAIEARVP